MGRRSCPTSLGARGRGQAQASSAAVCAAKAGGSQEGPDGSRAGVRGAGREVRTRGSSGRASVLGPERSPRTPRRHSPRVLHVDALVGGAGGRRLGEGGRAEDALRPGVHGGLEEPGERGRTVSGGRAQATGWAFRAASAGKAFWRGDAAPVGAPSSLGQWDLGWPFHTESRAGGRGPGTVPARGAVPSWSWHSAGSEPKK